MEVKVERKRERKQKAKSTGSHFYAIVSEDSQFMGQTYRDGLNEKPDRCDLDKPAESLSLLDGFILYRKEHLARVFQNGTQLLTIQLPRDETKVEEGGHAHEIGLDRPRCPHSHHAPDRGDPAREPA